MNRAEKRSLDRSEKWFNGLSEDKKQMIYNIINERIDLNNNMMSSISDTCTVGALDDILDINISIMHDVIIRIKEYMIDYGEFLEKEKKWGIDMIENQETRNEIKSKIKKYMAGKMEKSKGLKLLKHEFNLPYGEISDLWIECKSGNCTKEMDMVPVANHKEIVNLKDIIVEENIIYKSNTDEKPTTIPEKKTNLRVVKVTTEVEGEYGHYVKNCDGVKIGDNLYSDKDMVKKEKIKLAANYNVRMDEVRDKIKILNIELKAIQDLGMKEIERFTEIESVFDL